MKLKKIVGISLIVYVASTITVIVAGLIAAPINSANSRPQIANVGSQGQTAGGDFSQQDTAATTGGSSGSSQPTTNGNQSSGSSSGQPSSGTSHSSTSGSSSSSSSTGGSKPSGSSTTPGSSTSPSSSPSPKPSPSPSPTPTPTPTPPPPPPPAPKPNPAPPPCGSAGGSCSAAQIAAHNSAGNCWVIYNGGYYNVTSYVPQHKKGTPAVFNSATCGHDISPYLHGQASTAGKQHNHSSGEINVINSYYIGKVV